MKNLRLVIILTLALLTTAFGASAIFSTDIQMNPNSSQAKTEVDPNGWYSEVDPNGWYSSNNGDTLLSTEVA